MASTSLSHAFSPSVRRCFSSVSSTQASSSVSFISTVTVLVASHSLSAVIASSSRSAAVASSSSSRSPRWRTSVLERSLTSSAISSISSSLNVGGAVPFPNVPSTASISSMASISAAVSGAVSCTSMFASGGDLAILDVATFAATQSVSCNSVLRHSSSLPSTSPLVYVLSPFAGLGPSIASLCNMGLIAVVTAAHTAVARFMNRRAAEDRRDKAHSGRLEVQAMSKVYYPALSLMVASIMLPGAVRGAMVGMTSDDGEPATKVIRVLACVVSALAVICMTWLWRYLVLHWCRGERVVYRREPLPWVQRVRSALSSSTAASVIGRVLLPTGHWTPTSVQRRVGVVFGSVAGPHHRWLPGGFLLISVITVAVSAAPASTDNLTGCSALNAVLAVLTSIPAVVIIGRRGPYRVGLMNAFAVLNSLLTALAALITAVALQHLSYADTAVSVVDALATVLYVSSGVRSLLLIALRVVARLMAPVVAADVQKETAAGGGTPHATLRRGESHATHLVRESLSAVVSIDVDKGCRRSVRRMPLGGASRSSSHTRPRSQPSTLADLIVIACSTSKRQKGH